MSKSHNKILMALQEIPETTDVCLGDVPNLMKLLSLTAIKAGNWTPGQGVIPAGMAHKL